MRSREGTLHSVKWSDVFAEILLSRVKRREDLPGLRQGQKLPQELKAGNRNSKERDSNTGINWRRETNMPGTNLEMSHWELSGCRRKRAV
jgi:hypothetical protein